ncbi:MAG: hypothetical protein E6Q85_05605 [Thiothrix sp.]|nr:MAG: hypothetical protein E6Q85_05605 [Thiothrix sp.]
MPIQVKALLFMICCACLSACQDSASTAVSAPVVESTTVLPTKQTQQAVVDKLDAAQQVNQQRLEAAEKF